MAEIMVVAEQRAGELRETTMQLLAKTAELCREHGHRSSVVLLGSGLQQLIGQVDGHADTIIVCDDPALGHFSPDHYKELVASLVAERKPLLTLLGHSPWSMDLAPALAVRLGYPLATDCVDVLLPPGAGAGEDERPGAGAGAEPPAPPKVVRQVYSGKLFARMAFMPADGYLATVRAGSFAPAAQPTCRSEIVHPTLPPLSADTGREFLGFEDTSKGEVDISRADLLVSVGRGIGDEENLPQMRQLADLLGGTLSCSRPVVDKKWLPKYHQVGTSGKSVKPKVYLALGISGAFQHVAGITGAGTVIAVNKDKKAPIFRVADYGVVADLLDIVAALKAELGKR
jgi:electron transfer flavoprotein alpha subunit